MLGYSAADVVCGHIEGVKTQGVGRGQDGPHECWNTGVRDVEFSFAPSETRQIQRNALDLLPEGGQHRLPYAAPEGPVQKQQGLARRISAGEVGQRCSVNVDGLSADGCFCGSH